MADRRRPWKLLYAPERGGAWKTYATYKTQAAALDAIERRPVRARFWSIQHADRQTR